MGRLVVVVPTLLLVLVVQDLRVTEVSLSQPTKVQLLHGGPVQGGVPDDDRPVGVGVDLLELVHGELGDVVLVNLVNTTTHPTVGWNSGNLSIIKLTALRHQSWFGSPAEIHPVTATVVWSLQNTAVHVVPP